MLKRIIPSSGELLPVLGLGTWERFDIDLSIDISKGPLLEVLGLLSEARGSMIDSSPMYGKSEKVIGDLTCEIGKADDFFYATKVWTSGAREGIKQMEASMQKMKRTTLDLMQVHNLMDYKSHLRTLKEWKEAGKIRYIGVTHYQTSAHDELERIIRSENIDFVQLNYSIKVRNAENGLLKKAREKGVAVIINEPFEKGDLFRIVKGKPLPEWCVEYDINDWSQYFLKYIISNEAVNCVIPATANPDHFIDNRMSGVGVLPDEKGRKRMVEYLNDL